MGKLKTTGKIGYFTILIIKHNIEARLSTVLLNQYLGADREFIKDEISTWSKRLRISAKVTLEKIDMLLQEIIDELGESNND